MAWACEELPDAAVVPVMKRKTFKELGTPTVQAAELGDSIKEHSAAELLALAQKKYTELEAAGEVDAVADAQDDGTPAMDDSIVGSELEICWRYWREPTAEEVAAGEKRKKISVKIWCEGVVTNIANGTTTTVNPDQVRCKKLAKAGAVRIRWPDDRDREVPRAGELHLEYPHGRKLQPGRTPGLAPDEAGACEARGGRSRGRAVLEAAKGTQETLRRGF